MKATISKDGYIIIEPENSTEAYALSVFIEKNQVTFSDEGQFKNIVISLQTQS